MSAVNHEFERRPQGGEKGVGGEMEDGFAPIFFFLLSALNLDFYIEYIVKYVNF